MGAWGVSPFENDAALDWLADLEREGPGLIERALGNDAGFLGYFDADDAVQALAAAELVAGALGHPAAGLLKEPRAWLERNAGAAPARALREKALDAVRRVRAESELRDLWETEPRSWPEWNAALDDLERRLRAAPP